jgi:hypothetical protein
VLQRVTTWLTRGGSRSAKPLSTYALGAIAPWNFPVWYGSCDTPGIASRLGGAHHKEKP